MAKIPISTREYDCINKNPDGSLINDFTKESSINLEGRLGGAVALLMNKILFAKQDFLRLTKGVETIGGVSKAIVNYLGDADSLEIGLRYEEKYRKDGGYDVRDFYKIFDKEFKGKGFQYDSSREMFDELPKDFEDILNYYSKPHKVKMLGLDKAVIEKNN